LLCNILCYCHDSYIVFHLSCVYLVISCLVLSLVVLCSFPCRFVSPGVCPCVLIALVFHLVSSSLVLHGFISLSFSSLLFVACVISLKTLLIDPCLRLLFFSNVTEPVIEATTHAQQVKHKGY